MKIFNWVQNKLTGKKFNTVPTNNHIQQPSNEEVSYDWPDGLLAIGTLGSDIRRGVDPSNGAGAGDRRDCCGACSNDSNDKYDRAVLVHGKGKDIGKKSLSFVLKKMFVCTSGFSQSPAPCLRDPIPESSMEKILRNIIQKKIYPQSCSPRLYTKKPLESSHVPKIANGDEKPDDGSKWVKTDSEYIVLEI
ncbi:hypothetical protein V6N13_113210 [Hibiscus sabdariffa]|uniref:Uncharacterized protein n=1 Tax=Hibiscus sabdariffa TaxID=183260 RepID=A0ABR2CUF0_9ROSI